MQPIAVGALEQHRISLWKCGRRIHDGRVPVAEIAAKRQSTAACIIRVGQFDDRGAQNMARVEKSQRQAGHDRYFITVGDPV